MDNLSLFDFLPEEEAKQYRAIKSDDWKWTMANDYPKEKNGLNYAALIKKNIPMTKPLCMN